MLRSAFLSGLILLTAAPAALAEDAVVVANRAAPLPTATAAQDAPEPQMSSRISDSAPEAEVNDEGQIVYRLPRSQVSLEPEIVPERKVRGSAGAAIGTGGYRSGYVAGEFPVGETGTLGVMYSETDHGDNPVYVPYGGYGGYGRMADPLSDYNRQMGYGYGSVMRGGKQKSLSLSLDFSDRVSAGIETSRSCSRGTRADDELRAWDDPVAVRPYGVGPASQRFDQDC